jgi:hypothetical protein
MLLVLLRGTQQGRHSWLIDAAGIEEDCGGKRIFANAWKALAAALS